MYKFHLRHFIVAFTWNAVKCCTEGIPIKTWYKEIWSDFKRLAWQIHPFHTVLHKKEKREKVWKVKKPLQPSHHAPFCSFSPSSAWTVGFFVSPRQNKTLLRFVAKRKAALAKKKTAAMMPNICKNTKGKLFISLKENKNQLPVMWKCSPKRYCSDRQNLSICTLYHLLYMCISVQLIGYYM